MNEISGPNAISLANNRIMDAVARIRNLESTVRPVVNAMVGELPPSGPSNTTPATPIPNTILAYVEELHMAISSLEQELSRVFLSSPQAATNVGVASGGVRGIR